MKRSIVVIDDFHQNPDEIRKIALNSPYPEAHDEYTYPGKNSDDNFYPDELHQRFEQILNRKLIPAPKNGYFRLSLERDSFKQDVHVDPSWEFGAVCYLNTPDQCIDEGGTSFGCIIKPRVKIVLVLLERQNNMDLLIQRKHGGQQSMEKVLIEINGQDIFSLQ